jgi:hypothetical protein
MSFGPIYTPRKIALSISAAQKTFLQLVPPLCTFPSQLTAVSG